MHAKICLLGAVASGKTTVAKRLSRTLDIPWYELDRRVNMPTAGGPYGNARRSPSERDAEFGRIVNAERWIIEGVPRECFREGIEKADTIVMLDTAPLTRKCRIARRFVRQILRLERATYRPSLEMLRLMYKWSSGFDRGALLGTLAPYAGKLVVVRSCNARFYADMARRIV